MQATNTQLKQMLIRVPPPLKAEIKAAAEAERMSIGELCRHVLRSWIEDRHRTLRAQNGG